MFIFLHNFKKTLHNYIIFYYFIVQTSDELRIKDEELHATSSLVVNDKQVTITVQDNNTTSIQLTSIQDSQQEEKITPQAAVVLELVKTSNIASTFKKKNFTESSDLKLQNSKVDIDNSPNDLLEQVFNVIKPPSEFINKLKYFEDSNERVCIKTDFVKLPFLKKPIKSTTKVNEFNSKQNNLAKSKNSSTTIYLAQYQVEDQNNANSATSSLSSKSTSNELSQNNNQYQTSNVASNNNSNLKNVAVFDYSYIFCCMHNFLIYYFDI